MQPVSRYPNSLKKYLQEASIQSTNPDSLPFQQHFNKVDFSPAEKPVEVSSLELESVESNRESEKAENLNGF